MRSIGRATAQHLARRAGLTVYATARRLDPIEDLRDAVEEAHNLVGALVNNAEYSQSGAIETVSMADVRRQFEKAITARRPRRGYPVTPAARLLVGQRALLPDRAWDAVVGTSFPRPS